MCNPELVSLNAEMQIRVNKKNANPKAKISVPSIPILSYVYRNHLAAETDSFQSIMKNLKDVTIDFYRRFNLKEPEDGAFNNCNGRWCEYIFATTTWNLLAEKNRNIESEDCYVYIKLPNNNSSRNNWTCLLEPSVKRVIDSFNRDSTNQLIANFGHNRFILYSSNPDSMILKFKKEKLTESGVLQTISGNINNLNTDSIQIIDGMFNRLRNSATPSNNLVAFLSVKSTLRPDRRYQFVHEGDVAKATIMFVAARGADPGLAQISVTNFLQNKVFAVSFGGVTNKDLQMTDIAMSACVSSPLMDPVWSLDKLFDCKKICDANAAVNDIIDLSITSP